MESGQGGGVTRREKRGGVRPDAGNVWEPVGRREEVRAMCTGGCFLGCDWQCLLRRGWGEPLSSQPPSPPVDPWIVTVLTFPLPHWTLHSLKRGWGSVGRTGCALSSSGGPVVTAAM